MVKSFPFVYPKVFPAFEFIPTRFFLGTSMIESSKREVVLCNLRKIKFQIQIFETLSFTLSGKASGAFADRTALIFSAYFPGNPDSRTGYDITADASRYFQMPAFAARRLATRPAGIRIMSFLR